MDFKIKLIPNRVPNRNCKFEFNFFWSRYESGGKVVSDFFQF